MAEERDLALARVSESLDDEEATKADLQRRMEETRESISQTVTEIKETVMNQYQQVRESISDTLDWREQYRRRPVPFTVGAFGVGMVLGYSVANALKSDDIDDEYEDFDDTADYVEPTRQGSRSYAAQPIIGTAAAAAPARIGLQSDQPTNAIYEEADEELETDEEAKGPGLIARFRETRAYDRLQDELSTLGDRVVDELSKTAQSVVIPALLLKLKDLIGIDLSTQRNVTERSRLEETAAKSSAGTNTADSKQSSETSTASSGGAASAKASGGASR